MSSPQPSLPGVDPYGDPVPDPLDTALGDLVDEHGYTAVRLALGKLIPTHPVPSAPARSTDPETSHRAAKREQDVGRFSAKSRQAKLLQLFYGNELTDQQATIRLVGSHAAPSAFDGCRRRCSDLRAVGYLCDTGKRRKNAGSEDESIVWTITRAGKEALHRLAVSGWSR